MIKLFKNNKTLTVLMIDTFLFFVLGIIIGLFLNNKTISDVYNNLIAYIKDLSINNNYFKIFLSVGLNNIILLLIYWLFGISIIGVLIIGVIYSYQVFIMSLEFYVLVSHISHISFIFVLFYIISSLMLLFVFFIQAYYSLVYSHILFRHLFKRGEYSLKLVTKRYFRVGLILLVLLIVVIILKIFLLYFLYPLLS